MLPTPFQLTIPQHRIIRSFTQVVKPFLNNIIFQYTNPLPVDKEAHSKQTFPLIREHVDIGYWYVAKPISKHI